MNEKLKKLTIIRYFLEKHFSKILLIYILGIVSFVSFYLVLGLKNGYYLTDEDETINYNSARLFYETNSLKSSFCNEEQRSVLGGFNWYGPGYHVIYGGLAKLFGFSSNLFIVFNYVLFLLSIGFSFLLKFEVNKRLIFTAIFISTYSGFCFVFTYFPETLHIFFTIVLLVVYSRINSNNRVIYLYILLIFIFSIIRYSTVFWIFSLLFLDKSILPLRKRIFISFFIFLLILFWFKFFTAPSHLGTLKNLQVDVGLKKTIIDLFFNSYRGLIQFFNLANSSMIFVVILFIMFIEKLVFYKGIFDNTSFGILFVCILSYFVFLFNYTTIPYYFEKQTMFILPMLVYLILKLNVNVKLVFFISIFFLPFSLTKMLNNFYTKSNTYLKHVKYEKLTNEFKLIFNGIVFDKKEINVLWNTNDFIEFNVLIESLLPVSKDRVPILYTCNFTNDIKNKYKLHNRIRVDYILTRNDDLLGKYTIVKQNRYYCLYKIN